MKTCSMCGTLLFDDAEQCTKCGLVLTNQAAPEGSTQETPTQESPPENAEPEAPVSEPPPAATEPATPEPATPEPATPEPSEPEAVEPEPTTPESEPAADVKGETNSLDTPQETAEPSSSADGEESKGDASTKRQKWLEEQDKIKAELANILGRVGRKKKPVYPQVSPGPGMMPAQVPMPTQVSPQMMTPVQQQPTAQAPAQAPAQVNPNIQTNVGTQPIPQSTNQPSVNPSVSAPQAPAPAPTPTTAQAPAPAPTTPATGGTPAGGEGGLSEVDKKELMNELDDLRNEGYNVTKLERIIKENPGIAWKAFSDFLDDIEKLNQLKARVEQINTEGLSEFGTQKGNLLSQMNDPDLLTNYESQITQFENSLLAAKSEAKQQPAVDVEQAKKVEQSKKLIGLAKEAFRVKQYDRALDLFTKASERDPSNKEIGFFIKKVEAKMVEGTAEELAPEPEISAGTQETYEEPSEEVVVAKKKKKKKKKVVTHGAGAPAAPAGVDQVTSQAVPGTVAMQGNGQIAADTAMPQPGVDVSAAGLPGAADGPRTAAEFEALGFNAYINKDYPKALEFYQKVLEIDPNFPNVQNIINECQMRLGKK